MQPQELIQKTRDFLADPAHWTKCAYGRDEEGRPLGEWEVADAVSCCLKGALLRFSKGEAAQVYITLSKLIVSKGGVGVMSFNDDPTTTHEDVLALLDEAKENCNAS